MARQQFQAGFTLIELMITVAIVGILAAIAIGQYSDYTRRARMSEVVMASTSCKTRVSESYLSLTSPPASGSAWGCEAPAVRYASAVQTSVDGVIRVTISNLDPAVNGLYMHLVPMRTDGTTAMTAAADLGNGVARWLCGSDALNVRKALPAECRNDTTPYASATFE
jgi:type IV pilus assembly protein PilA